MIRRKYFIFYIPLNTFGFGHITWPILHLFTFDFNGSSRAPAHGPGPNGICKPTLVFGRSPAGVLKLGTCISFHVLCMFAIACIFARFICARLLHGELSAWMNRSCAGLQCISSHSAAACSRLRVSFSSPPPPHSATCACRVVVLPLHAFRCSICFLWHRMHSTSVCTVSDASAFLHHLGVCVVLLRPNGLGRGREDEISCARSCYEGTCSGLSPSGRSELLFGAAPPCISLFDLFPMASNAFHFGLHGFDASAFTSLRTSYRLLGWVTFVHHSVVKVHVRLPACIRI